MSSWGRMQFCSLHARLKVSTSSKPQLAEGRLHGWDAIIQAEHWFLCSGNG